MPLVDTTRDVVGALGSPVDAMSEPPRNLIAELRDAISALADVVRDIAYESTLDVVSPSVTFRQSSGT